MASGSCGKYGEHLTWILDDNGILTISGKGEMADWQTSSVLPSWYGDRTNIKTVIIEDEVTSIGNWAFYNYTNLTRVIIGNGEKIIGTGAFSSCTGLTSVIIGNGVTSISASAFSGCSNLTSITIPDSVEILETNVFQSCTGLTSITIGNSVTSLGNHVFSNCTSLTSITIPDSVQSIGDYGFQNCTKLSTVKIGNGITTINQNTFYGCTKLTNIEIPERVETIEQNAFYNCTSLSTVYYGGNRSQWNDIEINSSGNTELIADDVTFYFYKGECGSNLNYEFDRVDTLIIRGTGEMYNYNTNSKPLWDGYKEKIKEIIVEEGVLSIGTLAFFNCTNVTSVLIENSVISINEYAFNNCTNLNIIEISDSVKTISDNAFSDCNNLSTVDYRGTQKQWSNIVIGSNNEPLMQANIIFLVYMGNCGDNLTYEFDRRVGTITIVGEGDMYDYNNKDNLSPWSNQKENIKTIILPELITKIGNYAFFNCDNLDSVNYKGSQIDWDNVNIGSNNNSLTEANITFFEIKLSCYLTEDTDLTTLIDLIDYANAKSQEGYKFVVYYSSVEEKKKIIEFRINYNKEFETYYIGKKGELNINFDKVEECYLEKELFVNRKIDFLNIPGRDGNRISGMTKGTLTGSIINQLSIPYIGANSTADETCNYFSWLFGEDKFTSPTGTEDKKVTNGTPIENLPNEVIINSDSIPAYAFSWCSSIKSIELANNLNSVGDYAFYQIGTTSLNIPKSLSNIGNHAFYSTKLEKINWTSNISTKPNDENEYSFTLGEESFYLLEENGEILYPEINSIKFLDEKGIQAKIVEAENSDYTFDYENGLVKDSSSNIVAYFSLPYYIFASKLNVGRYPHFAENNGSCGKDLNWFLNTKTDENGNEYYSLNISGTGDMFDFESDASPWEDSVSKIKEIVLSEKITSIGNNAFKGCPITTFKCPQNLEKIGIHSFEACSNLEEVILSDKLTTIGDYAFKGCKMQTVVLPDNIKNIGEYAFSYNSKLVNVDVSKVEFVGEGCFAFCSSLESLTLPFVGETASATELKGIIGHTIGGKSTEVENSEKYETVTQIYESVLNNANSVKTQEYKIPISLKEIHVKNGDIRVGAFSGLSKVEKIVIEDATSMGINIFWGTENLKEIKVPYKSLTKSITSYYSSSQNVISYLSFNNGYANFIERLFSCSNTSQIGLYNKKGVQIQILPAYRDTTGRMYIQMPLLEKIIITNANLSQVGKFSEWRYKDWNFDLELPDNMELEIKNECFENSNIKNLNINVIPIVFNQSCFKNSKIKRINNLSWSKLFLNTTKIYQDAFNGKNFDEDSDLKEPLVFSKLTNINAYAFRNVIANSVVIRGRLNIEEDSFRESLIEKIEIDGANYIYNYAFFDCIRLTRLTFSNVGMILGNILSNNPELEEIITPFIGQNFCSSNTANPTYSFMQWFHKLGRNTSGFSISNFNYPYGGNNFNSAYATSVKLPKLKKIIITGDSKYIPMYMFYDVKRWFTSLEGIYFMNLASSDVGNVESAFYVYQDNNHKTVKVDKYWYFNDEFDAGEILPVSSYRMSVYSDNSYSSEETPIISRENEQRVIKLLSDKDYSWKALLYGKDYDVYITDNNTYADGSSYLPKLYLPNNSRMEQGQQITLIGENTYSITDLEEFSCSNKIFYRQSKGVLNGKLNYFNTVTGTVTRSNDNWKITDDNFKASITDVAVNFTIGSVYDSNHNDGTIRIENDEVFIEQLGVEVEINEAITITIEKALVTEGSIDANLINVIKEGSRFTTSVGGQLQTVNDEPENYYNIKFTPGFYVGDNGYNNVNITIADETLILPNDLLGNTVLLSIETKGKLVLEGTTGDNIKKGIISENLIGIIKKGKTSFVLIDEKGANIGEFVIKDIDKNNNQIVFENEEQNGFVMKSETAEYKIELKDYIDIAAKDSDPTKNFDITDLHLILNHINIFDVESIEEYEGLETSKVLKEGEKLYLITTKETINPTDYQVLDRSLEKSFTLERYTTIATVETIDKSNVQHILVYPDTFYEIKSNCIETLQYYFQTSEKQDTIFYLNDTKIEKDFSTDQNIINLNSSSAKITAEYQGNLIWYKWTIQENIDGEYYTIKEFVEYYNPNIILNYDLFRNNTEYRLILSTKTKEDLEVNAYLYVDVNYGIDSLDNIIVDKDCVEKAIKISFLGTDTKNKFSDEVFVTESKYGGIEYIYVEEEDKKLYTYLGDEKYLFYNINISYDEDYTFSYKVTTVGSVAIRFYDTLNNNISENVVEVIKDGFYNEELNAIIVEGVTELLIPYYEHLNIAYFNVGFHAPEGSYFSELQLEPGLGKTEYEEGALTFAEKGIRSFIVLREDVDDENSLCKLGEVDVDAKYFYDYSFNRELTYQYYIVPVFFDYINGNDGLIYGPPHKLNNQINYNLKEVTLIDTIIDITPNEETQSFNTYEANKQEYSMWHFKYNTDAKSINVVTDKTVYETTMKIPIVNKTNRNYKTGTIKAFLGGFVKENNKLTYRDSIKLQNKFQEFCDNGRVKMLRDEIGNVLPVDVTLTSFEYNPHTIPTNITVTFEWTQVGEEENLSVWRSE